MSDILTDEEIEAIYAIDYVTENDNIIPFPMPNLDDADPTDPASSQLAA
jgi:hypothetical protein